MNAVEQSTEKKRKRKKRKEERKRKMAIPWLKKDGLIENKINMFFSKNSQRNES